MATKSTAARPAANHGPSEVTVRGPIEVMCTTHTPIGPKLVIPEQTPPEAVDVRLARVEGEVVTLFLGVHPDTLCRLLDEWFTPSGWCCRRYSCGGVLYTALGLLHPITRQFEYKDAPAAPVTKNAADPAVSAANTSFWRAAGMWGICADVRRLPPLRLKTEDVGVVPVLAADGRTVESYRLAQPLRVDRFGRDDAGRITHVQLTTAAGVKIVWQES